MPYIYKITNDINGKIYIGKTLKTVKERWKEHCSDYQKERYEKRPLYSAMKKYGVENFYIEEIEECSDKVLSEREKYWIEYYGSFKYGYNATLGGDGKPYADYELIYNLWINGLGINKIQEITKYNPKTIRNVLTNYGIIKEVRQTRGIKSHYKAVVCIDKDTDEIIEVFLSVGEAEKKYPTGKHITDVCKGKRKTAGGYKWKYLLEQ